MNNDDLFREGRTSLDHVISVDDAGPSPSPEAARVEPSPHIPQVSKSSVPVHFLLK